jgi:hypothetical protein
MDSDSLSLHKRFYLFSAHYRLSHSFGHLYLICFPTDAKLFFYIMTLLNASAESLYIEDWKTTTPRQILSNTASRKDENEMLPLHHLAAVSDSLSVESLKLLVDVIYVIN